MKKPAGLVFVIVIIVGLGILLFSDLIEFERDEARVKYEKGLAEIYRQEAAKRRENADGGMQGEEYLLRKR